MSSGLVSPRVLYLFKGEVDLFLPPALDTILHVHESVFGLLERRILNFQDETVIADIVSRLDAAANEVCHPITMRDQFSAMLH